MSFNISPGRSFPLGATVSPEGVNFCVYSSTCSGLELLLFDSVSDHKPSQTIAFDPQQHCSVHYWHVFVHGLQAGQLYAYRAYGDFAPERGLRFDPEKLLLDPYAKAIVGWETYRRPAAIQPGNNAAQALKCVVVDPSTYDWENDIPLQVPYSKSIIYELHVGGFTRHPSSGVSVEKRGTYAGLIDKIPYLQQLGVTAVELLPIHQFDEQDADHGKAGVNYWGYSTLGFFAPHWQYSSRQHPLSAVNEFRDLVKALHKAGIQVILDVVFNHTAEGNHEGPTLCFKGLDNPTYYILEPDQTYYSNYTGCGNTVKANHQIVGRLIIDSLRYWVTEMHVDGFRFDLAAVLARGISGGLMGEAPPVLWAIDTDPMLIESKVIAEAWDAAGLYGVGHFISKSDRFAEWNGPFRDDMRRFVKGDPGMVGKVASRILGSPDIYQRVDRASDRSINFICCHDGFTLNDLVSYNEKHNEANGEANRDGANDNFSWNCGVEGATNQPDVEALRLRQIKNLLTLLFLSQGTPMLLMGDEVRRSQRGNNNAYCQDNEISWFDWSCIEKHADVFRFVQQLIQFTQSLQLFSEAHFLYGNEHPQQPYLIWHGVKRGQPDWSFNARTLAFTLCHPQAQEQLHVIFNAYWEDLIFELPPPVSSTHHWYRMIDTAKPTPEDFCHLDTAPLIAQSTYSVMARSSVVLMSRLS
ncbi:MAG TPA: glycogen debranching protein GlgX [Allocoleopsis sp.]